MTDKKAFKNKTMWIGFNLMLLSVVWSILSLSFDLRWPNEFSWFSASGAVMVTGSILFERLQPGTSFAGGSHVMSLPSLDQQISYRDKLLMRHGGKVSIIVLIIGTLIWAYGVKLV